MGYKLGPNTYIEIDDETMGIEVFSKGERFVCLFDKEDYPRIKNFRWVISTLSKRNRTRYISTQPYVSGSTKNWRMMFHQLIMSFPDAGAVDHINHCGFDNRKKNLRVVSKLQNAVNKNYKHQKTGFKGVVPNQSKHKPWKTYISIKKCPTYLGSFETREEAALAYDKKAIELHGEFAILNFPEDHKLLA
jgi:hypothetical protein